MKKDDYKKIVTSSTLLKNFLNENNLYLTKKFGQNFLHDKNIINKIIKNIPVNNNKIIEIGPGVGTLPLFYSDLSEKTQLIEIDKGLVRVLNTIYNDDEKIDIIHSDFLKYDLDKLIVKNKKYIIISNLPYNAASQILIKLIHYIKIIKEIYIMAPDIYVKTLIPVNNKYDSKFGVLINLAFNIEKLFTVNKNSFFPAPEIGSVFMKLVPEKKIKNIDKANTILTKLFTQKRRKLKKVLECSNNANLFIKYIDKRIQELTIKDIIYIIKNW